MSRPSGRRYEPIMGFGVPHYDREYIRRLSYIEACRQYRKDAEEDYRNDKKSRDNFFIGLSPLGFIAPRLISGFLGLLGLTPSEDPKPHIHENLAGLSFPEIKKSWDTLVDHFGPGVVELPKDIPKRFLDVGLDIQLIGEYGENDDPSKPYRIDTDFVVEGKLPRNTEPYRIDTDFVVEGRLPGKTSSSEDQENVEPYRIDTGFVVEGKLPKSRNPSATSSSTNIKDNPADWEFEPEPIDRPDDPRIPLTLNDRGGYRGVPNDDNSGLFTPGRSKSPPTSPSSDLEDDPSNWEFEPEPIDRPDDPRIPLTLNDQGEYRDVPYYHPLRNHIHNSSSVSFQQSSASDFSNDDAGLFQEQEPSELEERDWGAAFDEPNDDAGLFQEDAQPQERGAICGGWIDSNDLLEEQEQTDQNPWQAGLPPPVDGMPDNAFDNDPFDDYRDDYEDRDDYEYNVIEQYKY